VRLVNVVCLLLILSWSSLCLGCASKVETVYITKLILPEFNTCVRPPSPVFVKYRLEDEDLNSTFNFNAWIKNQITHDTYEKDLSSTISCYEDQIQVIRDKQQEIDNVQSSSSH
jgi:hypothetical protein